MAPSSAQLVTIIAEAVLEHRLVDDLHAVGATGWSVSHTVGGGSHGVRASEWEGANLRIETVVDDEVAEALMALLAERYFEHYAVVAWVHEVGVVRASKYTKHTEQEEDR